MIRDGKRYQAVTIPTLARPNLAARILMLMVGGGTAQIAWLVPSSATTHILATGGAVAEAILILMTITIAVGWLDVVLNDFVRAVDKKRGGALVLAVAALLRRNRSSVCYLVSGCYLLQAYAGLGSGVPGTVWLLVYYLEVAAACAHIAWTLTYLDAADVGGKSVPS